MKHTKCKNSKEWIHFAEEWLTVQRSSGARSLFLPAGNTCIPIFEAMNNKNSILNEFELYQIDEVITGRKTGLFADFFKNYLGQLKKPVRGLGEANVQADLAWLGLGLNGHVGFHEPGLPSDFASGCVRLSEKTCKTLELEDNTWGLTYGAGRFMQCQAILMLVRGSSKREVLQSLEAGDTSLPASALLSHKNFTVLSEGL